MISIEGFVVRVPAKMQGSHRVWVQWIPDCVSQALVWTLDPILNLYSDPGNIGKLLGLPCRLPAWAPGQFFSQTWEVGLLRTRAMTRVRLGNQEVPVAQPPIVQPGGLSWGRLVRCASALVFGFRSQKIVWAKIAEGLRIPPPPHCRSLQALEISWWNSSFCAEIIHVGL